MRGAKVLILLVAFVLIDVLCQSSPAEPPAEPEAGPETEPEAEGEPTTEGESPTTASYAEPEPDWAESKVLWGSAWEVHVYFFGVSFGIVALYSILSVIRLWKKKHLLSQKYFISLNILVFFMGTVRSVYLLIDPYNTNRTFPEIVSYILYTMFLPCVTSTFSLLFLSLLSATRMQFISPSIQKTKVIVGIILVHFVLALTTDILTVCHLDARVILFICQIFYIIWGLFLFIGFIYIFGRLYKAAKNRQTQMNKYAQRKLGVSQKIKPEQQKLTLSLGTIVTLISSILGFLTVVLLIYGMVDVYGVFIMRTPESWRWWGYHTAFRTLELAICITVSYVATQPFRYSAPTRYNSLSPDSEKSPACSSCFFYCAPCWSWCSRGESYLLPDVEWSDLNSEFESTASVKRRQEEELIDDPPPHHVVAMPDGKEAKTIPDSPDAIELGKTTPALLKSEHGVLLFSGADRLKSGSAEDNPNTSNSMELTRLRSDLEFSAGSNCEDIYLRGRLVESTLDSRESSPLITRNARWSEQSLDRISQLSPELETSAEDERSGLIVDV